MIDFKAMIEGYHRFRAGDWSRQHARWSQLAEGQDPKLMVIACSDSRVDPSQIFDTSPGEMFVVRNIANLVPPFELGGGRHGVSAAIEFAVTQLEVPEIVVLGHGQCGGVAASLSPETNNVGTAVLIGVRSVAVEFLGHSRHAACCCRHPLDCRALPRPERQAAGRSKAAFPPGRAWESRRRVTRRHHPLTV